MHCCCFFFFLCITTQVLIIILISSEVLTWCRDVCLMRVCVRRPFHFRVRPLLVKKLIAFHPVTHTHTRALPPSFSLEVSLLPPSPALCVDMDMHYICMNSLGNRLNLSNRFPVRPLLFFLLTLLMCKNARRSAPMLTLWGLSCDAVPWLISSWFSFFSIHSLQMSTVHENNMKIYDCSYCLSVRGKS